MNTPSVSQPSQSYTVDKAIDQWLRLQGIGKRPGTLHYHQEVAQIIRERWTDLQTPVDQVTDEQCIAFAESISHYCASRFNGTVFAIRKIVPRASIIPRRRYSVVPRNVPTPDEFQRVIAALDVATQGNAGLVIRFIAQTGLRINEARQLRWENVREDHVYLPGEITKNGRPRCVPFVDGTREVVNALKRVQKYHHDRRGFVLPQGRCNLALRYACRFLGLPRYGHHTFRHYFATQCIKSGVDIPTVAKWLGHSDSGALLLKCYCHLIDEHTTEMAKRVKVGGLPLPLQSEALNVIPLTQPATVETATLEASVLGETVKDVAVTVPG